MSHSMFISSGKEEKIYFSGYEFKYILKPRSYDTNHLIIVLSGFGSTTDFNYDFQNALKKSCRAAILWIKDDFFHNNCATYYLNPLGNNSLENAVNLFIQEVQAFLGIDKNHCTFLGCSKGGASALYYGIKNNIKNIVMSAPTLLAGSFVGGLAPQDLVKPCAKFMCNGVINDANLKTFDHKILNELLNDQNYDKNIFLISSESDYLHADQIKPFIGIFNKYSNFNYIEAKSPLVRTHPDVTFFNAPLILSIINCLAFNMTPAFLNSITLGDDLNKKAKITKEPIFEIKKLEFDHASKFHIEGIFFLRGIACAHYSDLDYILYLESTHQNIKIHLAKGNCPSITKDYYADAFVNYDKSYFCTKGYAGLSLANIPLGQYKISIEIIMHSGEHSKMRCKRNIHQPIISPDGHYEIFSQENNIFLEIK